MNKGRLTDLGGRASCGYEFCYLCRAPFKGEQGIFRVGNAVHDEKCKYHSSRLPTYQPA